MKENINAIKFISELQYNIKNVEKERNVIFCCIGTNNIIGDSVGPITGTLLKKNIKNKSVYGIRKNNVKIYGDFEKNLTYCNAEETIYEIKCMYDNPFIISIDSALSNKMDVGNIVIENNGIDLGKSLNKSLIRLGNIGIKVVVGRNYYDKILNFEELKNSSIENIMQLSKIISKGIIDVLNK